MSSSMDELLTLLSEEENALTSMVAALSEEQEALIAMDVSSLERVNQKKNDIVDTLASLSDSCRFLMTQVGKERGIDFCESPQLTKLLDGATGAEQELFKPLQKRLIDLAANMERQSAFNRKILANASLIVNRSFALFGKLLGGIDTYGDQGRLSPVPSTISFVRKEI